MSRPRIRAIIAAVIVMSTTGTASAQAIDRPPRSTGGVFAQRRTVNPNAPVQELSMMVDVFGGYDDNVTEGASGEGSFVPRRSTYVGRAETELRFRKARRARSFEALGRGFLNHASIDGSQFIGGEATVQASTDLGRRSGLNLSLSAANEPTFLFDAFGSVASQMEGQVVSDSAPAQGVTNQRWLVGRTMGGIYRNLSTRQRIDVQYIAELRRPLNGSGFDSQSQTASLRHDWRFSRNFSWQTTYNYEENAQSDPTGSSRPLRSHTADLGLRYTRLLSGQRRVIAAAGGGASRVRAFTSDTDERREFVVPTGYGLARLDLGRTWALQADVRRDVTILQGVSPEPFAADSQSLRADGLFGERLQVGVSGAYSRGAALVSDAGRFEAAGATAQLQFILSRYASVFTGFRFYKYRLIDIPVVPVGFPGRYDRSSVQMGVTLWLPLSGRF